MLVSFFDIEPDIAADETRSFVIPPGSITDVPAGEYGLFELYCPVPACDCRRVSLRVRKRGDPAPWATISHAFVGGDLSASGETTYLEPLERQGQHAAQLLAFVDELLGADAEYGQRLERHYALVKRAVADPRHPCHARLAESASGPRAEPGSQLPPGTIGTKAQPAILRVQTQAMAQRLTPTLEKMGICYIVGVEPNKLADTSDINRIGQLRADLRNLSRHERRAQESIQRRRR